ncbi:sugar nucleotide-binding protein [Bacillus pumilus]
MKVLITGAGGQLGKELSRQLKKKDITVIALTRSMLNIADQQAVRHAMRHFGLILLSVQQHIPL